MEFNIKLSEEEAQIVLNALTKEPYGSVFIVVDSIQKQAIEQRKEKEMVK